nr:DUF2642 domain-containing protein [Cytobacillus purgationiresistens]
MVEVNISGRNNVRGILIENGMDILVIFDGEIYFYIPLIHVQNVKMSPLEDNEEKIELDEDLPSFINHETISYRKMLTNAKGRFVEVFVTGNKTIHGYITSILNDYLVFYSPVYKTMFISLSHIKWVTPYISTLTPFTLSNEKLPLQPSNISVSRNFEEQLKKQQGKLVVFDMGEDSEKIGLLKNVDNNIIEMANANGKMIFWKLSHLKTIHLP